MSGLTNMNGCTKFLNSLRLAASSIFIDSYIYDSEYLLLKQSKHRPILSTIMVLFRKLDLKNCGLIEIPGLITQ